MNTTHHGAPSWKAELSEAADRFSAKVESACQKLADQVARGLHKIGLHKAADAFTPPKRPTNP